MSGEQGETTERPWWSGTVCPTGSFRLKRIYDIADGVRLQQLITDTSGWQKRWVDIPTVDAWAADDE